MGVKGGRKHVKKMAAPGSWPLPRKTEVWTTKPSPGPHGTEESLALMTVLKDVLKVTDNAREAKKLIKNGEILVDGKIVKETSYPVGFMDVVSMPRTNANYRVIYDRKSRIALQPVDKAETSFKLCRIDRKFNSKKGKMQLGLHDGRNVVADKKEYRRSDVLKISLPEQKIMDRFAFENGATAFVIGGSHAGRVGKIAEVKEGTDQREALVTLEADGEKFIAPKRLVFIVGRDSPEIKIGA